MEDFSYNKRYYQEDLDPPFGWTDIWMGLNHWWAEHIKKEINPKTVFDAGCSFGLLVFALREVGVDARGGDISEYAISQAKEEIKPFVQVLDITKSIPGSYDLITCIEVLEHVPEDSALQAIANISAKTDDVIFSSSPDDTESHSHVNVHPTQYWVECFMEHGLELEEDYDASYIAKQAFRVRR